MQHLSTYLLAVLAIVLAACSAHPSVPQEATSVDALPEIFPDYTEVTIPSNIAPLNFMLLDESIDQVVARITAADGQTQTYGEGCKVMIDEAEWRQLRDASRGASLKIEVFAHQQAGGWIAYRPFGIAVARDEVDPYVSYRLIDPSYVIYYRMAINQRDITTFDEREVYNNRLTDGEGQGQCINCHSYQSYKTDNMLFHVRGRHGATVMVVDGKVRTVSLKRANTISAGVYPAWHPTERLVAFSTDVTHQWFHTRDVNKIEVFDTQSDLVLYDIDRDTVRVIAADTARLEVFPAWSPDGRWLYYCSADAWRQDDPAVGDYRTNYEQLRYNVYRRAYRDGRFGDEELVYRADSAGRSCSLPRVSPDGRYLTFAEGAYGYFNIWHHEADVRVLCLDDSASALLDTRPVNSAGYAESYPTWSSNGRWLMCASRRDDGNYSRIYLSHFDGQRFGKAFMVPQRDPELDLQRMQSFNRPEFMSEPVDEDLARDVSRQLEQL